MGNKKRAGYTPETIAKVVSMLKAKTAEYISRGDVESIKMAISQGNRKIGRVMNVSIPPIITCANCAGCRHYCYDVKACAQYANTVIDARARNLAILRMNRDEYFRRIDIAMARRRRNKYFRWHVAGDIVDIDYFARMIENARRHPDFIIWTYTKNYNVVNTWVDENGKDAIPDNFHVMFSEWRGMEIVNPHGFPEFRVVFDDDENKPAGPYCPGNCDVCKRGHGAGCIAGRTTYCHLH